MAKIFLEFENAIINAMTLQRIEKTEEWDVKDECMKYKIIFNKQLPDMSVIKDYEFEYFAQDIRDAKFRDVKRRLEGIEHVIIL